jgi:PIN domain nuclease of toxin-antitoxin system
LNLLLDTHVLFWWVLTPSALSAAARDSIDRADAVCVSAATAWEIATKVRIGKWPQAKVLIDDFSKHLAIPGFLNLPVTVEHARHAGLMPGAHKDPFDRLIAAQAIIEGMTVVSADPKLAGFGAPIIW